MQELNLSSIEKTNYSSNYEKFVKAGMKNIPKDVSFKFLTKRCSIEDDVANKIVNKCIQYS